MELLTIGELAARSGVATSALRYYESLGLLTSTRTRGAQRRYARSTLRRVAVVQAGQRAGLSLAQVREGMAELPADRVPTRRDWERLARRWRTHLDARIDELQRIRDGLADCIGCGCQSLRRCAVENPGDVAADLGPGARWLLGDQPPEPAELS
jgi:MerR family redox-sensitive transcriptional activator SoxR